MSQVSNRTGRETWGAYLQAALKGAGMTHGELARSTGIHRSTIGRWVSGKRRPDRAGQVVVLAAALGLDTEEAMHAAGILPFPNPPDRPASQRPTDPDLARLMTLLGDPGVDGRTKELIKTQLTALADLAERTARRQAG